MRMVLLVMARLDSQVPLVRKETEGTLALMEQKDMLVLKVMKEKLETLATITQLLVPVASKEQRATGVLKAARDHLDLWGHQDQMNVKSWTSS